MNEYVIVSDPTNIQTEDVSMSDDVVYTVKTKWECEKETISMYTNP